MTQLWRRLRLALLAVAGAIYVAMGYLASSSEHPPVYAVLVEAAPLLLGVLAACWNAPWRYAATALCLGSLAAVIWNLDRWLSHAAWLYFAQHAGIMCGLGVMFGSTLSSHEGALCSRIAAIATAEKPDADYLHYTWKVTLAWTVYFFASALISTGLFALARQEVWAFFATVLTPVSLGLMFGGEYLIRLRALPDRPHFSIAQTIQSYRKYTQCRG
jgi:uncharacterized membrane protein